MEENKKENIQLNVKKTSQIIKFLETFKKTFLEIEHDERKILENIVIFLKGRYQNEITKQLIDTFEEIQSFKLQYSRWSVANDNKDDNISKSKL